MTLGRSPLYAAVTIAWPPDSIDIDTLRELTAWLEDHPGGYALKDLTRVGIDEKQLQMWRRSGWSAGPLHSHPSVGILTGLARAGALLCAATLTDPHGQEASRCSVSVDDQGRHVGDHTDGTYVDGTCWPNGNPADAPPPTRTAPTLGIPTRATVRGVIDAALWLCHHDPDHPLSYTPPDTCKTCLAIDRAAAAVMALLNGDPR